MLITDRPADASNSAVDPLRSWIRRRCAEAAALEACVICSAARSMIDRLNDGFVTARVHREGK